MHTALVIAVAIVLIAAVFYIRRRAGIAAEIEADAAKLKTSAETEVKKIEAVAEVDAKKAEQAF